ncbi:MAG: hydrogenase maturation nickel metallochaperone HypA [Solirubrobacteraceae bacterium]
MHEFSVASAIVDTAVRHAAGRRVTVVDVRFGKLRQIVPDSLEFAFGILSRESLCEGARLKWEIVPARLRCAGCVAEWEIEAPAFRCPTCGTADVEVLSGEELEVESIEVVQEEAACIA